MDAREEAQVLATVYQQALDAFNAVPSYIEQQWRELAPQLQMMAEEFNEDNDTAQGVTQSWQ